MAFPQYCYDCKLPAGAAAKRCTNCGLEIWITPGTVVLLYTIVDILGKGGMGVTYTATDNAGRTVVVKQLLEDNDPDPVVKAANNAENLRRFQREAQIQGFIHHPRFPEGYGYFTDGGQHFIAMEFVPGDDLLHLIRARPTGLDPDLVLQFGVQVCEGLHIMHTYVDPVKGADPQVHRDIKPDNIKLQPNGEIKILDFGIARPEHQTSATAARGTAWGTREYVAPEAYLGNPVRQSDLYSVAATMFHLATGRPLPDDFRARPAEADRLPPAWQPIFRQALAYEVKDRQKNVLKFRQQLIGLLPPQLQPAPQPQYQPQAAPATPQNVSILWGTSVAAWLNLGEYRQPVSGQVVSAGQGVPAVNVMPTIIDLTVKPGVVVMTGAQGDFTLNLADVTVPGNLRQRYLQLVVEDPNTGTELCRDNFIIARPAQGFRGIARGAASPFQWAGGGIRNRWHQFQAWRAARKAAAQAAGKSPWYRRAWQHVCGWFAGLNKAQTFGLLGWLGLALGLVGIPLHQAWMWVIFPLLAAWCFRAQSLALQNKLNRDYMWRLFMPLRSAIWLFLGLIFALAR